MLAFRFNQELQKRSEVCYLQERELVISIFLLCTWISSEKVSRYKSITSYQVKKICQDLTLSDA